MTLTDVIASFPALFGLRAFPGLQFRIAPAPASFEDRGAFHLVLEVEREGKWLQFGRELAGEVRRLMVELPGHPQAGPEQVLLHKLAAEIGQPAAPAPQPGRENIAIPATTISVPTELIVNCLDSADIGYWASVPKGANHHDLLAGTKSARVVEDDGSHDGSTNGKHTLTGDKVRAGVAVMAAKYPRHFGDLLADNSDATTGDVLIQCALFGEIVYG